MEGLAANYHTQISPMEMGPMGKMGRLILLNIIRNSFNFKFYLPRLVIHRSPIIPFP